MWILKLHDCDKILNSFQSKEDPKIYTKIKEKVFFVKEKVYLSKLVIEFV